MFDAHFTDDTELDKHIKKTIANVNCGLLEKAVNKRRSSKIFENAGEALYYQDTYGGTIPLRCWFGFRAEEETNRARRREEVLHTNQNRRGTTRKRLRVYQRAVTTRPEFQDV